MAFQSETFTERCNAFCWPTCQSAERRNNFQNSQDLLLCGLDIKRYVDQRWISLKLQVSVVEMPALARGLPANEGEPGVFKKLLQESEVKEGGVLVATDQEVV